MELDAIQHQKDTVCLRSHHRVNGDNLVGRKEYTPRKPRCARQFRPRLEYHLHEPASPQVVGASIFRAQMPRYYADTAELFLLFSSSRTNVMSAISSSSGPSSPSCWNCSRILSSALVLRSLALPRVAYVVLLGAAGMPECDAKYLS